MNQPHTTIHTLFLLFVVLVVVSCGDPVPDDYIPELTIEATLLVDKPITDIKIYWSQSMRDSFSYAADMTTTATGLITGSDGSRHELVYVSDSSGGYYRSSDTAYRVQPQVTYDLVVQDNGRTLTASTTAPPRIEWIKTLPDTITYPGKANELNPAFSDSLKIYWTIPQGFGEFLIGVSCLDTLRYGEYLTPPSSEPNRRVELDDYQSTSPRRFETTRIVYTLASGVFYWGAFKWFGPHEVTVYCGDINFTNWFKQVQFIRAYNPNLASVTGGLGTFGSASTVSKRFFFKKEIGTQ